MTLWLTSRECAPILKLTAIENDEKQLETFKYKLQVPRISVLHFKQTLMQDAYIAELETCRHCTDIQTDIQLFSLI